MLSIAEGPGRHGRREFTLMTDVEMEEVPEPTYLVDDLLPAQALAVSFGSPGSGKTFQALDMAMAVATGRDCLGRGTAQGVAIYVVAEGGTQFKKRIRAWKSRNQVGRVEAVYFILEAPQLRDPDDVADFIESIRGQVTEPVALVVFDTLSRCFSGGDENSARDVGALIDSAALIQKELHATVVFVHHTTKKGHDERGSSVLRGAADTMFRLTRKGGTLTLRCAKQKDGQEFTPMLLSLMPEGDSCAITLVSARLLTAGEERCLQWLVATSGGRASLAEWMHGLGMPETSFHRYRKALVAGGYVEKVGTEYVATDKGTLAVTPTSGTRPVADDPDE